MLSISKKDIAASVFAAGGENQVLRHVAGVRLIQLGRSVNDGKSKLRIFIFNAENRGSAGFVEKLGGGSKKSILSYFLKEL